MPHSFFTDQEFEGRSTLEMGEYDGCRFINCNLEGVHLATCTFTDCEFEDCNLTNAQVNEAAFNEVSFTRSKLVGVHFYKCGGFTFSARFNHCQLNLTSFYGMNLSNCTFTACSLQEVDFTDATLTGIALPNCDLGRTVFHHTNLEKADLRTAYNLNIDPEHNALKGAKFSVQNVQGLLQKYGVVVE